MPELPEVEVVRAGLSQLITQKIIKSVNVVNPKSLQASKQDLSAFVIGATIISVRRRAKILLIDLSTKYTLVIHLKMTGQLIFRHDKNSVNDFAGGHPDDSFISALPNSHTRILFVLMDNSSETANLFFNDMRKFGWIKILPTIALDEEKFIAKLGPEPFAGDPTEEFLRRIKRHPKSLIKSAILNQEIIAGIGNIYADEALWLAQVHPATRVQNLSDKKLQEILQSAISVMALSIKKGGSTDRNYLNTKGERGSYLQFAKVFRKEGQPCARCATTIEKIRVGGRGTHICPNCQKTKGAKK